MEAAQVRTMYFNGVEEFFSSLDNGAANFFGVSVTSRGGGDMQDDIGRDAVGEIDEYMLARDLQTVKKEVRMG